MTKKFKRVKKNEPTKKGNFKKGTFIYDVDVSVVEVEEGVNNIVLKHSVKNEGGVSGEVEATIVWKNMDEDTITGFETALENAGIVEGQQTFDKFNKVVKEWRKLTKTLKNINDLGDQFAKEVLQEEEEDNSKVSKLGVIG